MRVVVTRPAPEARAWCHALQAAGFDALPLPLLGIGPLPPVGRAALRDAWERLQRFRAVMFVSAAAVQHFFDEAPAGRPWPDGTRAWAPGPGTAAVLARHGVPDAAVDQPAADAPQLDSETLWAAAGHRVQAGDEVLIVRGAQRDHEDRAQAGHGRAWMADRLAEAGAVTTLLAAYQRGAPRWTAAETAAAADLAGAPDTVWIFSSSEAVGHLVTLLAGHGPALRRLTAVATHPRIADTATAAGFARVALAPAGFEGLDRTLRHLRGESGR
ncbi:uroporphyrinogen-III synthase [Xylophilus sp. Kf1]|nr:uroporphyrinogen-III synthase [Xylophilus sp. Kf1]